MTIICADPSPISLIRLEGIIKKVMPKSSIYLCQKADDAELTAKKVGCDVLITEIDFGRKKGEGIELANNTLKLCPTANVIFATTALDRDYAPLIMKIKYSGYLTKPFGIEEMSRELRELRFRC